MSASSESLDLNEWTFVEAFDVLDRRLVSRWTCLPVIAVVGLTGGHSGQICPLWTAQDTENRS